MACQLRAPTEKDFTTGLAPLSHSKQSSGFLGLAMPENPRGKTFLLFILMPSVLICTYSFLLSLLSASKEPYHILSQPRGRFALGYNINCESSTLLFHLMVLHTQWTLGHCRWHARGPTMTRIFHSVSVQGLFCEIGVNLVSQLEWKALRFCCPPPVPCELSGVCLEKVRVVSRGGRLLLRIYDCSKSS